MVREITSWKWPCLTYEILTLAFIKSTLDSKCGKKFRYNSRKFSRHTEIDFGRWLYISNWFIKMINYVLNCLDFKKNN